MKTKTNERSGGIVASGNQTFTLVGTPGMRHSGSSCNPTKQQKYLSCLISMLNGYIDFILKDNTDIIAAGIYDRADGSSCGHRHLIISTHQIMTLIPLLNFLQSSNNTNSTPNLNQYQRQFQNRLQLLCGAMETCLVKEWRVLAADLAQIIKSYMMDITLVVRLVKEEEGGKQEMENIFYYSRTRSEFEYLFLSGSAKQEEWVLVLLMSEAVIVVVVKDRVDIAVEQVCNYKELKRFVALK